MTGFEYKVVPAPERGLKAKGVKGTKARFANVLQTVMNELGAEGWEYQRTDTLPVEERQGLTGKTTSFQNMLVFRRALVTQPDVAEVAALIEDQSANVQTGPDTADMDDTPDKADAAEDNATDAPAVASQAVQTSEEQSDDQSDKAARTLAAEERVSETLGAPFTFPWNRRGTAAANTDEGPRVATD